MSTNQKFFWCGCNSANHWPIKSQLQLISLHRLPLTITPVRFWHIISTNDSLARWVILLPAKVSIHLENKHFTSQIYKLSPLANRPFTRSPANESDWSTWLGKFNLKLRCCQHLRFSFGQLMVVTWLAFWRTE